MSKKSFSFYAIFIIAAAILWGIDGSVLRPYLYHLDVATVVFAEHFIAFVLMSLLALVIAITRPKILKRDVLSIKKLSKPGKIAVAWIVIFGGVIGTLAITKALFFVHFVPLSVPILIQKIQPIFAILLALIVLKERPKKSFYFWALTALVGSYLITFGFNKPAITFDNKTLIAALLGLAAAFAWGSSTVFGRSAMKELTFRAATYLRFGLTSVLTFALVLIMQNSFVTFGGFDTKNLTVLLIIALTSGGTAMFLYYKGLQKIKAASATLYELFFPITVVVLDYLLHGQFLSLPQLVGGVLILVAVIKIK